MTADRRRLITLVLGTGATLVTAVPSAAQVAREALPDGARLRVVDTATRRIDRTGDLVRWVGDTMVVLHVGQTDEAVRLRRWHRVDVSLGRHRHVVRNGLIGASVGAVVLAAVGAAIVNPEPERSDACIPLGPEGACWGMTTGGTPREMGAAFGAAWGVFLGGLVGGVTGVFPREKWVLVRRDVRVTMRPTARGATLGVQLPIGGLLH